MLLADGRMADRDPEERTQYKKVHDDVVDYNSAEQRVVLSALELAKLRAMRNIGRRSRSSSGRAGRSEIVVGRGMSGRDSVAGTYARLVKYKIYDASLYCQKRKCGVQLEHRGVLRRGVTGGRGSEKLVSNKL